MMTTENYQDTQNNGMNKRNSRNFKGLEETAAPIKEAAETLQSDLQQLTEVTKKVAQEALEHVKQNMGQYYKDGLAKTKGLEQKFETSIRSNPLSALAIAAGAGLILGALWNFSRSGKSE